MEVRPEHRNQILTRYLEQVLKKSAGAHGRYQILIRKWEIPDQNVIQ